MYLIKDYSNEESCVILQVNHAFIDGVGLFALAGAIQGSNPSDKQMPFMREYSLEVEVKRYLNLLISPLVFLWNLLPFSGARRLLPRHPLLLEKGNHS